MTRTQTRPLNDRTMWRRLIARTHPDVGGDHELFIWSREVERSVCSLEAPSRCEDPPRRPRKASGEDKDRIPYSSATRFRDATLSALRYADSRADGYGRLLRLLEDCHPHDTGSLWLEQNRGASYKRLAAIGHKAGMNAAQRSRWYDIARSIPLSDRHAGHILSRLKRSEAA